MYSFFKRLLDLVIATMASLILLPLLLPIVVLLRFTAEGEVFYLQERIGYKNSKFKIWKFATMLKNSLDIGTGSITLENDFRVTKFGKFLRKTKINELPQLINILLGDMSVVGPRPVMFVSFKSYPKNIQNIIYNVKPGLTGIGSIVFRDEEHYLAHHDDPMKFYREHIIPYKSDLELWFVENNTLCSYFKIIFVTAWVVVFPSSNIVGRVFEGIPSLPESLN